MNALRIALFRTSIALASLAVAFAVALGWLFGTTPDLRRLVKPGLVYVTRDFHEDRDQGPRFIDARSGRVETLATPAGEALGAVSLAPWRDDAGRTHAVGHWMRYRGQDAEQTLEATGLARFRFPDGEPLERVTTFIVPTGPPCWLPGTAARVVFASGDGRLYRFAFEGSSDPGADLFGCDQAPKPLLWRAEGPDPKELHFIDLSRPTDGPLAASGLILAALRVNEDGKLTSSARLWWLRLDSTGSEVLGWGPLMREEVIGSEIDLRFPTLVAGADGRARLAYLDRRPDQKSWRLRLAEIEVDKDAGIPKPLDDPGELLAEGCAPSSPAFSADGNWLCCVRRPNSSGPVVARFALGSPEPGPGELASADAIIKRTNGQPR